MADPRELDEDDNDTEPDFTLDDLEWFEAYPELDEDVEYCDCGEPFPPGGYCRFCGAHARYL